MARAHPFRIGPSTRGSGGSVDNCKDHRDLRSASQQFGDEPERHAGTSITTIIYHIVHSRAAVLGGIYGFDAGGILLRKNGFRRPPASTNAKSLILAPMILS